MEKKCIVAFREKEDLMVETDFVTGLQQERKGIIIRHRYDHDTLYTCMKISKNKKRILK